MSSSIRLPKMWLLKKGPGTCLYVQSIWLTFLHPHMRVKVGKTFIENESTRHGILKPNRTCKSHNAPILFTCKSLCGDLAGSFRKAYHEQSLKTQLMHPTHQFSRAISQRTIPTKQHSLPITQTPLAEPKNVIQPNQSSTRLNKLFQPRTPNKLRWLLEFPPPHILLQFPRTANQHPLGSHG